VVATLTEAPSTKDWRERYRTETPRRIRVR